MDVINLCTAASMLQASVNSLPCLSDSEDEESLNLCYSRSNFAYVVCGSNAESDEELCRLPCASSVESLDMLLNNLPDIVIPDPVFNPLPLHSLAVNSLPESVRMEIDRILLEFSKTPNHILQQQQESSRAANLECMVGMKEPSSSKSAASLRTKTKDVSCEGTDCRNGRVCVMEKNEVEHKSAEDKKVDIDTRTKDLASKEPEGRNGGGGVTDEKKDVEQKSEGDEKSDIDKPSDNDQVFLHHVVVKRKYQLTENVHDTGVGFRVIGGVKCTSCKTLHTVITSVLADDADPVLRVGSSIKTWAGKNLEGCTFEEVSVFLKGFADCACDTVEMLVKWCGGKLISKPKNPGIDGNRIGTLHSLKSFRRRSKGPKMILQRESSKSHLSQESSKSNVRLHEDKSQTTLQVVSEKHASLPSSPTSPPLSVLNHRRSSVSLSRTPSPPENVEVSIPRLDSTAKVLLTRPRSPISTEDGNFSRFANGMIQVSLTYDDELEDLQVVLWNVQGQSNHEIGDLNDVFINTYLIPDLREQGVRSISVRQADQAAGSNKMSSEESYTIKTNELDECLIRIILWDATKSKKIVFRGEVLLSLSDRNVIGLSGQATWFTVCPLDPNLPALPKPVDYRQQRNKEHILSKFVHRAQAFAHLTSGNIKTSSSLSGSFQDLSSYDSTKRSSVSPKHMRKTKSGQYDPHFLRMLYSGVDLPSNRHTINEAKLAKLNSIINVLRESEVGTDGGEGGNEGDGKSGDSSPPLPEFTNIFKTDARVSEEKERGDIARRRKQKKKGRAPVLRALREDLVDSKRWSDSSDNHNEDDFPMASLNSQTTAWLASQRTSEPGSDQFQIPNLRDSLNAGRRNRVSNYAFENMLEGQPVAEKTIDVESDECEEGNDCQTHYKLVDTTLLAEEEEEGRKVPASSRPFSMPSSSAKVSSPDFNCYPVPVEVSVHHICVVDVDKKKELAKADVRSRSMNNRSSLLVLDGSDPVGRSTARDRKSEKLSVKEEKWQKRAKVLLRPPSVRRKPRARSLGDIECLSSDEEVLLVRTPVAGQSQQQNSGFLLPEPIVSAELEQSDGTYIEFEIVDSSTGASPEESGAMSSLDSSAVRQMRPNDYPRASSPTSVSADVVRREKLRRPRQALSVRADQHSEGGNEMWMLGVGRLGTGVPLVKHRSMSSLMDPSEKNSSKNNWRQNYLLTPEATDFSVGDSLGDHEPETTGGSATVAGSAKLQLEYNDLNPQCPVLLVKLLDILLQSSKNLSSELLLKCQLLRSSTGVCILKNKSLVNIKNPLPSAPLGILQFQTNIADLSLEIMFLSLGKVFSTKKEIGHVSLDLNSLHLTRDSTYWKWLPIITKQSTA